MNVHAADSLPRAVLIDLGDTIVDILSRDRKRGLSAVLEFAKAVPADGPGRDELIGRLAEYGEELDDRFESLCARHNLEYRQLDFHRLLYGRFGIEFTIDEDRLEREYWKASLELAPAPGLEAALAACAARGIRMAVISNTTYRGFVLQRELERMGLLQYFDFVMASADYGIRKPDP
ncbi:MAG: HAD family hydrolase, partial [Sediminispirochaetaceae bacterium]